ncbi:MAG TPA: hypothetical protein VKE42_12280 [Candidatus Cybelea sp.]|nr:hypothetical protein [Candidatus Cybelea sp.]
MTKNRPRKPPSNYKVEQHTSGQCWLIFDKRDGKLFTTRVTRKEARETVVQQDALDALEAKGREAVQIEVEWKP